MKRDRYDNSNPYLWMLIVGFILFWVMQWAGSRPVKLTPRENRPAASYHQR